MKINKFWWMAGAAAIGLLSTFWQIMEKLTILKNKDAVLSCNLNSTFNCSNVLNADQSSVFGPPNALIGLMVFVFFFTVAIMMLNGGRMGRRLGLAIHALAIFMLGFTAWFLFESTYSIGSICIFCLFIGTAVIIINAVMLRNNFSAKLSRLPAGIDIFGWALVWLTAATAITLKFI